MFIVIVVAGTAQQERTFRATRSCQAKLARTTSEFILSDSQLRETTIKLNAAVTERDLRLARNPGAEALRLFFLADAQSKRSASAASRIAVARWETLAAVRC